MYIAYVFIHEIAVSEKGVHNFQGNGEGYIGGYGGKKRRREK